MSTAGEYKRLTNQTSPELLICYANLFINKISELLGCCRLHRTESQLVCWLLMTEDRLETSEIPITQAELAKLLGVPRVAVTQAAGKLQKQQLLSYSRDHLTILNRAGLEGTACSCYDIIKAQEENFLAKF